MLGILLPYTVLIYFSFSKFVCPFKGCERSYLGDDSCNIKCNNALCNFDSDIFSDELSNIEIFASSDCLIECLRTGCTMELLSNEFCDEKCNNYHCAFDIGFCGICSSGCYEEELLNEKCDLHGPCNTDLCEFDAQECNICVPGCGKSDMFKDECTNEFCKDDNCSELLGNPCYGNCSFGCWDYQIGNEVCDETCNNNLCNYDLNDCICSPNCSHQELETDCKGPSDPCNNENCK